MAMFKITIESSKPRKGHGVHTDDSGGRVHCRSCGRPVRSKLGDTCGRAVCQYKALGRAGMLDELGE